MSKDKEEKIACHVCKKEIPKSAALSAEGEEYVYHFCHTECMDLWKKNRKNSTPKK